MSSADLTKLVDSAFRFRASKPSVRLHYHIHDGALGGANVLSNASGTVAVAQRSFDGTQIMRSKNGRRFKRNRKLNSETSSHLLSSSLRKPPKPTSLRRRRSRSLASMR
jgi:hypothetical protein